MIQKVIIVYYLFGLNEAAEMLGIAPSTLRKRIADGRILPKSVRGRYHIPAADLERYARVSPNPNRNANPNPSAPLIGIPGEDIREIDTDEETFYD